MMDFKTMGAIASLLKDKDKLVAAGERVKAKLEALRVEGSSGGGAVRVVVTGTQTVVGVSVDPSVGSGFGGGADAQEMAEKLVADATNDGLKRAREEAQRIIEAEMKELGLDQAMPGLMGPGGLGGLLGR